MKKQQRKKPTTKSTARTENNHHRLCTLTFETLSLDSDAGALVLNPLASGKSQVNLPRFFAGKHNVRLLFSGMSEKYLVVQLNSGTERLLLAVHGFESVGKEDPGTVTLTYRGGDKDAPFKTLVKFKQAGNEKKDQDFQVNANFQKERLTATIAYWGNVPIAITMIDVVADFQP